MDYDSERPDPQDLLKRINKEKGTKGKGKLKIFFGYAAGVGKTYAMLDAAHAAQKSGIDVVIGYIEPHTRPATMALLEGIEAIPIMQIPYKGITLKEFDLDEALKRKPQLILVDELAHTNAEGCRHPKRYSDIEELRRAGIDVYTTVNVQHLESLHDIVESITRIAVNERIPDKIFDEATQVELVDVEPEELISRLTQGKIYNENQAKRALGNFFIPENLIALREIAMRHTADRLNHNASKEQSGEYRVKEHILVCLSSSPSNPKVIRAAARMAKAFHAEFTALFVETPHTKELDNNNYSRMREHLKLAQQLGARIATVYGEDVPYQIASYARVSGVSKVVMGHSNNRPRIIRTKASFVERLSALAPNLDVYIIPDNLPPYSPKLKKPDVPKIRPIDVLKSLGVLTACTLVGLWFYSLGFSDVNIIIVYLLGILVIAIITEGRFCSALSSVVGVLTFNFFFTAPRFSFVAYGTEYPITFFIMLVASLITSSVTTRMQTQSKEAALKAHRTEILLDTSQKLQKAENMKQIEQESLSQIKKLLDKTIVLYSVQGDNLSEPIVYGDDIGEEQIKEYTSQNEQAVAQWVFTNHRSAGVSTSTLSSAKCFYLSIRSHERVFAVIGIAMAQREELPPFEHSLLSAMLNEIAFAMEKYELMYEREGITMQAERERLRANLLRAISHDLRTPLTSISGNANVLLDNSEIMTYDDRKHIYEDIYDDSLWLINLVENLLSVTRIENGPMSLNMEPELIQEVISEALQHINRKSSAYNISVDMPNDMLMAKVDSRLIVQVIINIVDNAIKYTEVGSDIVISAKEKGNDVVMEISDNGKGIKAEDKEKIFDMFFTANNDKGDARRGLGLGLSLCRSIVEAHGGEIYVREKIPRGTVFGFNLKLEKLSDIEGTDSFVKQEENL